MSQTREPNISRLSRRPRLDSIAARIKPLPAEVRPSEFFVAHLRRRLIELQPHSGVRRVA